MSAAYFILAIWCSMSVTVAENSELPPCPTWMHRQNSQNNDCVCGISINEAVECLPGKYRVNVVPHFCIILSEDLNTTYISSCPYGTGGWLPPNRSELRGSGGLCDFYHRGGQLCGACEENYTLPVYSYYLGCVKCEDYEYGWLKFVAAAFVPLTAFYILVIIFRISVTLSSLNGFVLVSQIMVTPPIVREFYSRNQVNSLYHVGSLAQLCINTSIAIYTVWNLDFFRSFYKYICVSPDLKYQHVLLLNYAVAVYPLFLIFITFICVKLHDNFAIVVWLWRPFHKCLVRFRRQWNIRSYLVNALATFIVLSYVKILNISFQFLTSSSVFNIEGKMVNQGYWYYDGRVYMNSREYLPYLILALSMFLIFNIFPLVLLTIYPFKYFQKYLNNFFPCSKCKLALQLFLDTFHGCYKDDEHDYRHFAALYLAVRFFNLLWFSVIRNRNAYTSAATLLFAVALALVARFQPYKRKRSNTVDMVMLLNLITLSILMSVKSAVGINFPKRAYVIPFTVQWLIPPSYILLLALSRIGPHALQCFRKSKMFLLERVSRIKDDHEGEGGPALLTHEASGCYNTFPN